MKYRHALCLYPYLSDPVGIGIFPPTGLEYVATALKALLEGKKVETPETSAYGCSVKYSH